jgi:acetyl esterase/lipase
MKRETIQIDTGSKKVKCILLRPKKQDRPLPGIVWIHGGGYALGMAGMVHMSCGKMLAKRYGAVVISPEYTLAKRAPYPAALEDCCAVLQYVWDHARTLGIDRERIVVGGESAGGGLAAAVCLHARDHGEVSIAMQIPLYPMLDCEDTASSRDNHGRVWNTKRNHWGWSRYLGDLYGTEKVPAYASPARETDYRNLPPCYTFVSDGEPFYRETLDYVRHLQEAGGKAAVDVYPGNVHAFDMLCPWRRTSRAAKKKLCRVYEAWILKGALQNGKEPEQTGGG